MEMDTMHGPTRDSRDLQLETLLRTPLTVVHARSYTLVPDQKSGGEPVPDMPRILFVETGSLSYQLEYASIQLPAGTLFFFPGWMPRLLKTTSKTPSRFFLLLRMRYARARLQNSQDTVQQVAFASGFLDPFTFSKRYKRFFGVSPSMEIRL